MLKSIKYCNECDERTIHHNDKCQICKEREVAKEHIYWESLDVDGKLECLRENQQKLMKKTKGLSVSSSRRIG